MKETKRDGGKRDRETVESGQNKVREIERNEGD